MRSTTRVPVLALDPDHPGVHADVQIRRQGHAQGAALCRRGALILPGATHQHPVQGQVHEGDAPLRSVTGQEGGAFETDAVKAALLRVRGLSHGAFRPGS
jgi:hypothetical protein